MLMLLFYARWQFPTLRLKHKNLKKSSNRDVNMYKIQNKSYTCWLYTLKKHVGDHSQLDTICSVRIPSCMRWGSEHSGGCLFGLALCPDDIISRETELRTSVKYEEVELGKRFSSRLFMSPQWQIKPTLFTNYIFLAQLSIGKHLLRTNSECIRV